MGLTFHLTQARTQRGTESSPHLLLTLCIPHLSIREPPPGPWRLSGSPAGHANFYPPSHPGVWFPRALQNAPPCPLPKLSCPAEIRYLPPPKQLKMTWAIFALGSRCKLPLELTASHIPLDHCPLLFIPHQEPLINRTGGLLETTGLSLLDGETEAMGNQAWGWEENQASWVSAQVSFYCPAQPAPYPRSQSL